MFKLGPNYLLFYFKTGWQHEPLVKCKKLKNDKNNFVKCVFTKGVTLLEYLFKTVDDDTMIPVKIAFSEKKSNSEKYTTYKEIQYDDFKVYKDGEHLASPKMPVGLGCKVPIRFDNPILKPKFKPNFKFNYHLKLDFFDKEINKTVVKTSSETIISTILDLKAQDTDLHIIFNEGTNEETKKRMRTYYDQDIGTLYDYYPDSGKCIISNYHNLKTDKANWFYFQDLFIKFPKIQNPSKIDENTRFSYLGTEKIGEIDCYIFEKVLSGFNKIKIKNLINLEQDNYRKNLNKIYSDYIIATYYLPIDESVFPNPDPNSLVYRVPLKMEFRMKANDNITEIGILTIDTKNYEKISGEYQKEFVDFEKCIKKPQSYDLVKIIFENSKEGTEQNYDGKEETIKDEFRKSMNFISPFR